MGWFTKKPKVEESKPAAPLETDREPRFKVAPLRGILVELDQPSVQTVRIANISSSGVGFLAEDGTEWPSNGGRVSGYFTVEQEKVSFQAEIVHRTARVVGARFCGDNASLKKMILHFFDLELRARAMVQVKREMLKSEPDGKPSWFRSARGFEVFFVEGKEEEVVFFQIAFLGNLLEWGRGKGLRCGRVVDLNSDEKVKYKGSDGIEYSEGVPEDIRTSAIRVVENVTGLTEKVSQTLLSALSR